MAVTETFPPSPFTTALVDSDEDPTTRISDGGSSVEFSDDTPRPTSGLLHSWRWHWATALNLWSTENEHPTDDQFVLDLRIHNPYHFYEMVKLDLRMLCWVYQQFDGCAKKTLVVFVMSKICGPASICMASN